MSKNKVIEYQSKLINCLILIMFFMVIVNIGSLLNSIVFSSNNCKMPVLISPEDSAYSSVNGPTHFGYSSGVNYSYLADRFAISYLSYRTHFSAGDAIMWIGGICILVIISRLIYIMLKFKKDKKK